MNRDKIYFIGEKLPFTIMAVNENYAVVVRKLNRREDADLLHNRVEMGAYMSFTEAFKHLKNAPVYSIIDFKKKMRGPDDLVLGHFNYFKKSDCNEAIKWLERGNMKISDRNRCELKIDTKRTIFNLK